MAVPKYGPIPIPDLQNWNTDREVDPIVMTRGIQYKTSGGWWNWDSQLKSDDAGLLRVSAVGGSTVSFDGDAANNRVSAIQEDASVHRVSTFSDDAAFMRVSALGVTATTTPLSADADTVSAKQHDASNLMVSCRSDDAAFFRVNVVSGSSGGVSANQSLSARNLEGTAFIGNISAKNTDAGNLMVSARSDDATLNRVSAIGLTYVEDTAHSDGDSGVMALGVKETDDYSVPVAGADGDYSSLSVDVGGFLRTKMQPLFLVDACTATADFSVLGNDTTNLATNSNHLAGTASLSFDKVDGAANTKIAGIQKTLPTTINFFKVAGVLGYIQSMVYLTDITDCDYFFVRLGTDSSNYNEWRISIGDAWTAGIWETVQIAISEPNYAGSTGNGWVATAVDYMAFGVAFDAETDTLANILVDRIVFAGGILTTSDITASITSDINSANINLLKVGNKTVNTGTGNVGTGTQRMVIASDQTAYNVSAKSDEASDLRISAFSNDGGLMRVSALVPATVTVSATDLDIRDLTWISDSVEAYQTAAGQLMVSARSDDAAYFRVNVVSGGGSFTNDADDQPVSAKSNDADTLRISAFQSNHDNLNVNANLQQGDYDVDDTNALYVQSDDASLFRINVVSGSSGGVSANQSLSARNLEGTAFMGSVSANQAGTWAISALGKEGNAHIGQVSSTLVDDGSIDKFYGRISALGVTTSFDGDASNNRVSSVQEDANNLMVSARSDDAAYFRVNVVSGGGSFTNDAGDQPVSAVQDDASVLNISAKSDEASDLRVSTFSLVANANVVSAAQSDASILRTSAYIITDTIGGLIIGRLSNLSSSGNIKATAGSIYGYYAYNTTDIPQYINFTNTSGAINVGTDAVAFKAMLPASAAANIWFGQGLIGFTNGIGAYGTSAIADNATTPCATSAVGINLFYS